MSDERNEMTNARRVFIDLKIDFLRDNINFINELKRGVILEEQEGAIRSYLGHTQIPGFLVIIALFSRHAPVNSQAYEAGINAMNALFEHVLPLRTPEIQDEICNLLIYEMTPIGPDEEGQDTSFLEELKKRFEALKTQRSVPPTQGYLPPAI